MIELTLLDGSGIVVNPSSIVYFYVDLLNKQHTYIRFSSSDDCIVSEDYTRVKQLLHIGGQ